MTLVSVSNGVDDGRPPVAARGRDGPTHSTTTTLGRLSVPRERLSTGRTSGSCGRVVRQWAARRRGDAVRGDRGRWECGLGDYDRVNSVRILRSPGRGRRGRTDDAYLREIVLRAKSLSFRNLVGTGVQDSVIRRDCALLGYGRTL